MIIIIIRVIATSTFACNVALASFLPIVSVQPFIPPNVSFSGEPNRKRRREDSEASSFSTMEMWEEFVEYYSSCCRSCSSRICCLCSADCPTPVRQASPARDHSGLPRWPGPSCFTDLHGFNGPADLWYISSLSHLACTACRYSSSTPDGLALPFCFVVIIEVCNIIWMAFLAQFYFTVYCIATSIR